VIVLLNMEPKKYLTVQDAADYLDFHPQYVRILVREKKLAAFHVVRNGRIRFTLEQLDNYVKGIKPVREKP
jgi:excisionase family DNA binding protein